ncbi:DNA mismatch repair protein MutS [Petroclostridium sp. X23]|uniref:MutS-related protein n=1 Tax=Petroclostridium sp. X23 TaxID=3045146 RepID=UPI0024ADB322|nr:DNA mismatch repair protein MutS [Petroclostridium sp. X23]WHH58573.1 DNA mismatch repair protein MutS [Petroclostridium sp. X23]
MQDKFKKQIIKYEVELQQYSTIFNIVGYLKLAVLLIFISTVFLTFYKGFSYVFCVTGIAILLLQVFLWIYHSKVHDSVNYAKAMIIINKQYLDRISGDWVHFADIGEEFIDVKHPYACDLDIVGKKSLFQLLNVTKTWHGRQAFANDLLNPDYNTTKLLSRQEAILELSKNIELSAKFQYHLSKIEKSDSILRLLQDLKKKRSFIKSKFLKCLLVYCPLITVTFIAAMIIFQLKNFYLAGAALLLMQCIVWIAGVTKTNEYLGSLAGLNYKLATYSTVLSILQNEKFTSAELINIKKQLTSENLSAAQAIKDLGKISDRVNVRHQGIIWFILNVLFLWDYECAFMMEEWKEKYARTSENWFLALGEFESLLSFSTIPNVCSNVTLPDITNKSKVFEAMDIGHPLILNSARVYNNIIDKNNIIIISGSNMSGKTTFLRTIGINLVMANAGGFVCAKTMTCSLFKIMTSMRISDDLNDGVSTFYAELKKIKRIIDTAKNSKNTIFLIDEIFRGTNSVDRLYGAKTIISKLDSFEVMGVITTHDLELCEMANQYYRIKNYSFSEHYKENKILFDYKIRQGKSNTTNAKYLMQMVGIL